MMLRERVRGLGCGGTTKVSVMQRIGRSLNREIEAKRAVGADRIPRHAKVAALHRSCLFFGGGTHRRGYGR